MGKLGARTRAQLVAIALCTDRTIHLTTVGGGQAQRITRLEDGECRAFGRRLGHGVPLPAVTLRSKQRLRDKHNLLEVLLNSVDIAMVACTADGRLTRVNRRAHELMGNAGSAGMDLETWTRQLVPRTAWGYHWCSKTCR